MPQSTQASLPLFPTAAFDKLLPLAFEEDVGQGDITSIATIAESAKGTATLYCKQAGVLAGLPLVERVFRYAGFAPRITLHCQEGESVGPGRLLMTLEGPLRALLVCERILLNFLQRFSGIATSTHAHAMALSGTHTRLLDTRKTLPGYRLLDKYAVAVGGGTNHRMGLYDRVLVKDNHAAACGSVRAAVDKVHAEYGMRFPVEAEVSNMQELQSLLNAHVDTVLLDNMDDETLQQSVAWAKKNAPALKLEASGNMSLERLAQLRDLGLDFISVGALTHSVHALDISMKIQGTGTGALPESRSP